jgi:hypothetical protein
MLFSETEYKKPHWNGMGDDFFVVVQHVLDNMYAYMPSELIEYFGFLNCY